MKHTPVPKSAPRRSRTARAQQQEQLHQRRTFWSSVSFTVASTQLRALSVALITCINPTQALRIVVRAPPGDTSRPADHAKFIPPEDGPPERGDSRSRGRERSVPSVQHAEGMHIKVASRRCGAEATEGAKVQRSTGAGHPITWGTPGRVLSSLLARCLSVRCPTS